MSSAKFNKKARVTRVDFAFFTLKALIVLNLLINDFVFFDAFFENLVAMIVFLYHITD